MFNNLKRDIKSALERDPAARSPIEVLLLYPGLHAILLHRLAHRLWLMKLKSLARMLSQLVRLFTGVEIHPGAQIGPGLFIDHGMGVVIGETTEIGENVTLFQGVTLGGTGKEHGKRHPTLGNNVLIGVGAKVLGAITIGDNSIVGAGAVVLKNVPANCTAVGIPARVVKEDGQKVTDLRHEQLPDPVTMMFQNLNERLNKMERKLASHEHAEKRKDEPPKED